MARAPKSPPPRTLSSQPLPSQRVPHAAHYNARFPSLLALLAGDVLLQGCYDPTCAPSRADELEAHGQQSVRSLGSGNAVEALRQLGLAMGVVSHPGATTTVPDLASPGEAPMVTVTPPRVPAPDMGLMGAIPVTGPTPTQTPPPHTPTTIPHPRQTTAGAVARVRPAPVVPVPQPPGGIHRADPTPPVPDLQIQGGPRRVNPARR
jgi:hypothetical protein